MMLSCPGQTAIETATQGEQGLEALSTSTVLDSRLCWAPHYCRLPERGGAFLQVSGHLRIAIGGMCAYPLSF